MMLSGASPLETLNMYDRCDLVFTENRRNGKTKGNYGIVDLGKEYYALAR